MPAAARRPRPRRILLLCNQLARLGSEVADTTDRALRDHGLEIDAHRLSRPGQIPRLIREHRGEVDGVVLAGGDGTARGAARALRQSGLPFGLVPIGTANDLARTLGIPIDPIAACRVIAEGHSRTIDIGDVNGHHFFNAAGIGLSVDVTRRLTGRIKQRWGVAGYARAVLDALEARRTFRAEIRAGGEHERVRSVQITVANGVHYGGGLTIAEDAAIDDRRLDLYSLPPAGSWRLLAMVPALRLGRIGRWQETLMIRAPEIEVATERSMRVTADGVMVTRTPARFRVYPDALRVFVPREGDDAAQ